MENMEYREKRKKAMLAARPAPRKETLVKPLNQSQKDLCCCICTLEFAENERVVILACHKSHILHEDCFKDYEKHQK